MQIYHRPSIHRTFQSLEWGDLFYYEDDLFDRNLYIKIEPYGSLDGPNAVNLDENKLTILESQTIVEKVEGELTIK